MSGGGGSHAPVDVFKKALIVGVLFIGLLALFAFRGVPGGEFSTVLMSAGFVILASYTIGELAEVGKLPHITGYLLAGLLLGGSAAHTLHDIEAIRPWMLPPFDEGLLNEKVLKQLGLMDTLALALICLTAGGELKLESLREGLGRILAILGAQTVTILGGITALFFLMSQSWSPILFDKFAGLDTSQAIALGLVLASVSLATAPAATIAIINSTGSKGPMTSNVLPVVVLKDVVVVIAFSAATAVAVGMMGAEGGGSFGAALLNIGASIILGVFVGVGIDLYLRYVGAEILIFIVGMVFATAELATAVTHWIDPHGHPELALVFIAAGFSTSNFSSKGDELIHEVERLSLPVYVVFFTMAGAKLHIEDLVSSWQFALLLVGVRILMLWIGVRIGALVPGTDAMTRKYGWMGFISQAGLALTLAGSIQTTFGGEVGNGLFSLILAGVALNEIIGPVALQFGLGFAGETAAQRGETHHAEDGHTPSLSISQEDPLDPWRREDAEPDAWGENPGTASDALNTTARDLELSLRQLLKELDEGPLAEIGADAQTYVRALRRDFLRFHRHISNRWAQDPDPEAMPRFLRTELATLAERWRDHLLVRSKAMHNRSWSPAELQAAVDALIAELPEEIEAPIESDTLAPRKEAFGPRVARSFARFRARISSPVRRVNAREIARYHFQGKVAKRMEGLAALTIDAELHLAARTASLFDSIDADTDRVTSLAKRDPGRIPEALQLFRESLEQDFRFAIDEATWIPKDAHVRTTAILGGAMKELKDDLLVYDSPDLPRRHRRFGRVFDERNKGLNALTKGYDAARETTACRYAALALAFEVVGLETQVKEAVDVHVDLLVRQLRGKGLTQMSRVEEAMRALVDEVGTLLEPSETPGPELATTLRAAVEPKTHILENAIETTTSLRDWLAEEVSDEPLLDAILASAQDLSERYAVPIRVPTPGDWTLPDPVPTTELPFREVTVSFIEAHITRDLIDVTRRLSAQVDDLVAGLQEMNRVLTFNAELAQQELEVQAGPLSDDNRKLVSDIVIGSWGRGLGRLEALHEEAQPWPDTIEAQIHEAVLDKVDTFQSQVLDGRITDLRHTLLRQVEVQRRFLSRAGSVSELVSNANAQVAQGLNATLGHERIAAIRYNLGFKETVQVADPGAFAKPPTYAGLPTVYRRLFSDHALEAGDLLTGRDAEYAEALAALRLDRPGMFRTVALVGLDTIGRRALASALIRGLGASRVTRHTPTAPLTTEAVDAWFTADPGGVVLLEGIEHLFEIRPGGFEPLKRFVQGIVDDAGKTAFIVLVDPPVWHFAVRARTLDSVFAATIQLGRLSVDELEAALINRHSMSGYGLQFESSQDLAWQIQDFMSRTEDTEQRHQKTWFRTLHQASGGVLHDAMQLWTASVLEVDEGKALMRMGPVPQPPISRIRRLPETTLLTLRQVARQGWTTPELYADQFRVTLPEARAHLAGLAHAGLLHRSGDPARYTLTPHLAAPIIGVLTARGWFQ